MINRRLRANRIRRFHSWSQVFMHPSLMRLVFYVCLLEPYTTAMGQLGISPSIII